MSEMTPQRRNIVILCALVAIMSSAGSALFSGHPKLKLVWLGMTLAVLVYALILVVKWKRSER